MFNKESSPKAQSSWHQYPLVEQHLWVAQTTALVFSTLSPHLCYDIQGPTLSPFQKPCKKRHCKVRLQRNKFSHVISTFFANRRNKLVGTELNYSMFKLQLEDGHSCNHLVTSQFVLSVWKNPSPLHQTWGLITKVFSCHQTLWLWLLISPQSLPAILRRGKGICPCQMLLLFHSWRKVCQ